MVDEFTLDKDICMKKKSYDKKWLFGNKMQSTVVEAPSKLFLFHIDERYLQNGIYIKVKNDNSNYMNGFMTKYSYINFFSIFLIPAFLMKEKNWLKFERFRKHDDRQYWRRFWPRPTHSQLRKIQSSTPWVGDLAHPNGNPKGGSFAFEIPIYRKHKILHLGKPTPGRLALYAKIPRLLRIFNALNNI